MENRQITHLVSYELAERIDRFIKTPYNGHRFCMTLVSTALVYLGYLYISSFCMGLLPHEKDLHWWSGLPNHVFLRVLPVCFMSGLTTLSIFLIFRSKSLYNIREAHHYLTANKGEILGKTLAIVLIGSLFTLSYLGPVLGFSISLGVALSAMVIESCCYYHRPLIG